MKKKIIAVLLSACMLVSACPTGAFAMSDEETNTYTATGDVMQAKSSSSRLHPKKTMHVLLGGTMKATISLKVLAKLLP